MNQIDLLLVLNMLEQDFLRLFLLNMLEPDFALLLNMLEPDSSLVNMLEPGFALFILEIIFTEYILEPDCVVMTV